MSYDDIKKQKDTQTDIKFIYIDVATNYDFLTPKIFASRCRRRLIFLIMNSVRSILSDL